MCISIGELIYFDSAHLGLSGKIDMSEYNMGYWDWEKEGQTYSKIPMGWVKARD